MSDPNDDTESDPFFPPSRILSTPAPSANRPLSIALSVLLITAFFLFLYSAYQVQLHLQSPGRLLRYWDAHPLLPPSSRAPHPPSPPPPDLEDSLFYAGHDMTSPAIVEAEATSILHLASPGLIPPPHPHLNLSSLGSLLSIYSIVWDYGGVGCSGWALEANLLVYGLSLLLPSSSLHVLTSPYHCSGLPPHISHTIHQLSTQPLPSTVDFLITHRPPPRYPRRFPYSPWGRPLLRRPHYLIARSMTEVHRIPSSWATAINSAVDEVWLPSTQQLAPFLLGGTEASRLFVVPEPFDSRLWAEGDDGGGPQVEVSGRRAFAFLSVFKLEERKGWRALLYAFFSEFSADDDVSLHLLTYRHQGADPRNPRRVQAELVAYIHSLILSRPAASLPFASVHVVTRELPTTVMPAFYRAFDGFVLPTHGEGWGLPVVEAMRAGLVVVATNSSGMLDYLDEEVGYLVRVFGWEKAQGPEWREEDGGLWASVSVQHLRQVMRAAVERKVEREVKARRGKARVMERYTPEVVAERMVRRLAELVPIVDHRRALSVA